MEPYILVEPPENKHISGTIHLPASKSLSNRALMIQALGTQIKVNNLSDAQDTKIMAEAIRSVAEGTTIIDIGHAGTAMRFLTAFLSVQSGSFVLTGSHRMQQRPIGPLVSALQHLGAEISYLGEQGYPPLKITGKPLRGGTLKITSGLSSQFVSALLLIGPTLPQGLTVILDEAPASPSYIRMTMGLMAKCAAECNWEQNTIRVMPGGYPAGSIEIEPDWSAASYFYAALMLAQSGHLIFPGLKQESLQGDAILFQWFDNMGLQTQFSKEGAVVVKTGTCPEFLALDFTDNPDLAQTLAMALAGCGMQARFKGLHTLPLKETDRIKALVEELYKVNYSFTDMGNGTWQMIQSARPAMPGVITFKSHDDHRMAMSCTPLALRLGKIQITDPGVVDKSFPGFWKNCADAGFILKYFPG